MRRLYGAHSRGFLFWLFLAKANVAVFGGCLPLVSVGGLSKRCQREERGEMKAESDRNPISGGGRRRERDVLDTEGAEGSRGMRERDGDTMALGQLGLFFFCLLDGRGRLGAIMARLFFCRRDFSLDTPRDGLLALRG